MNCKIDMPKNVKYIISKLENEGYASYLVGGAVRDSILKRKVKDWDITTSAKPLEIIKVFKLLGHKIIPTGLKHGTVTVVIDEENYEVTTFRIDGNYSDGRKPDSVEFTTSLKEDLSRRDFTINAMAYNDRMGLIDYFGGLNDLKYEELSCVGNAEERFKEDKLRILRAIRFASRYNFDVHRSILYAISEDDDISNLSKERIRDEFNKIILCDKPSLWLKVMRDYGLLHQIIPELRKCYRFEQCNPNHNKDVFEHILAVIDNVEPKLELRLSALFHDIGKPNTFSKDKNGIGHFYEHHKESAKICRKAMTRLKYPNKIIEYVSELVYYHMTRYEKIKPKSAKKFINKVGVDRLDDMFKLFIADRIASKPPYNFDDIFELNCVCKKVLNEKQPLSVKDLDINGYDLMKLGVPKGKEIGKILNELLDMVLENPELNKNDVLINKIKNNKI